MPFFSGGKKIKEFVVIFALPQCLWRTLCLVGDLVIFTLYMPCRKRATCCVVEVFFLASELSI